MCISRSRSGRADGRGGKKKSFFNKKKSFFLEKKKKKTDEPRNTPGLDIDRESPKDK